MVGVSIGALNSAVLALYEKGHEEAAITELYNMWTTYHAQDFWSFWPYFHVMGGLMYDAFLDSSPLRNILEGIFKGRPFKRKFSWQAVDLNTGSVVIFDETVPDELKHLAVLASASLPGFFSPVQIGDMVLVDGGTYENLDLAEAIVKCRKLGAEDKDIIVDVILCTPGPIEVKKWTYEEARWKTSWDMNNRKKELKEYYYYKEDVERVMRGFPHIQFRYIMAPSVPIPESYIPIFQTKEEIDY